MLTKPMHRAGFGGWQMHVAALGSVCLCIGLWIRAKTWIRTNAATPSAGRCSDCGHRRSGSSGTRSSATIEFPAQRMQLTRKPKHFYALT